MSAKKLSFFLRFLLINCSTLIAPKRERFGLSSRFVVHQSSGVKKKKEKPSRNAAVNYDDDYDD